MRFVVYPVVTNSGLSLKARVARVPEGMRGNKDAPIEYLEACAHHHKLAGPAWDCAVRMVKARARHLRKDAA